LTRAAASSIPVLKVDEERWEEDRMIFRVRAPRAGRFRHLDVADDHVRLEVTLPWLLNDLPKWRRSRSGIAATCC